MTIKNILCPVDLSPTSRRALDYASVIAAAYAARLRVLQVVDMSMPPLPAGSQWPMSMSAEIRQACLGDLHMFVSSLDHRGAAPEVHIVEGQIVAELLHEAERMPADLIVMGTHGRGGFERLVLGSVAEKVLRKARCPILTVPPDLPELSRGLPPFPSIVCAFDFSRASSHALMYAWSLARDTTGRLAVVHVVEWPFGDMQVGEAPKAIDALRDGLELDARRQLHEVLPKGALPTGPIEEIVTCGRPSHEILRAARERSAALIVMGVQGRGAVSLAVFGSTTHRVIREAHRPVLTVRSNE